MDNDFFWYTLSWYMLIMDTNVIKVNYDCNVDFYFFFVTLGYMFLHTNVNLGCIDKQKEAYMSLKLILTSE